MPTIVEQDLSHLASDRLLHLQPMHTRGTMPQFAVQICGPRYLLLANSTQNVETTRLRVKKLLFAVVSFEVESSP